MPQINFPAYLDFVKSDGSVVSDTESEESKEEEKIDTRNVEDIHIKRLERIRRDYKRVKIAPFPDEEEEAEADEAIF